MNSYESGSMTANCRSISVARAILRRCDGFKVRAWGWVGFGWVGSEMEWRGEAKRDEENYFENRRRGPLVWRHSE